MDFASWIWGSSYIWVCWKHAECSLKTRGASCTRVRLIHETARYSISQPFCFFSEGGGSITKFLQVAKKFLFQTDHWMGFKDICHQGHFPTLESPLNRSVLITLRLLTLMVCYFFSSECCTWRGESVLLQSDLLRETWEVRWCFVCNSQEYWVGWVCTST